MERELLNLFEGNSELFITTSLTGEVDERGKHVAKTFTVHEPVTLKLWKDHLEGAQRIGIKPENGDVVKWGCIDIDPQNYKGFSEKKIVDIIREHKLPLIPARSKSGGLHLFIFLKDWTPIKDILKVLHEWNNVFFQSLEVFPMNKCMNMPYFNMDATTEHAYDDNNSPVLIGRFLELAKQKTIAIEDLLKLKIKEYEPESNWKQYPPCCQKLISEPWTGNHRNDLLFNMGVLEMKKADGNLTKKEVTEILLERNKQIFSTPLPEKEVISTVANSVSKKNYALKCNTPLCDKEKCKFRNLGIGSQVPDMIEDFKDIEYVRDTKSIQFTFEYQGHKVSVTPEDMKDEKSWRTRLLRYGIYWMTLPRPKSGPPPFELLLRELVVRAQENVLMKYEDTLEEEKYTFLKDFFENHIEEDDFDKLKDNYVILDSKTNECYFRKITLERFHGNKKIFKSIKEALDVLNCERLEYHEGVKNVWKVQMPEFVEHMKIKSKQDNKNKEPTEMDDDYHTGKFRT
mgnify:CR=1 FL=1|tara:strand:- start:4062 stop:5603 length:1542 start_codon:yes stop_codon:yes gene_type:complete